MQPVQSVAIIGAGNMGSGIAQKTAQEEFDVQMVDREAQWVERGQSIIANFLSEAVERRIFSPQKVEEIQGRITGVVGTENTSPDTDLVIEAVFEDFDIKTEVFNALNKVCGDKTILASNTSSLSVNKLAEASGRTDRFVGLHFFYHPAKNRLVEVIPGINTSKSTIERTVQYCKGLGKVVIICKDRPGFVVNRFFVPWLNEACLLLQEGIATTAAIDYVAMKAFNIGMGPFALMNLTGPPIALHSTDYLASQLDTPRYVGSENLRELVSKGEMWAIGDDVECSKEASEIIRTRLMGQVFAVAGQIVDEEICSLEDVDRGAKVGLRWARGPFELANRVGINIAKSMAENFCELANLAIPKVWKRDEKFKFNYVDTSISNGISTITINRPEAMNALNEIVVKQLELAIDKANSDDSIHTIVLDGAGKAFVAGADVKFFVDNIRSDTFSKIYDFTAHGHAVQDKLENSGKTTVALTTGLALGGGLELALACDYRIGTRKTQFRFPETSIGIYPGLGGTQRTARICGIPSARWAVLSGNFMDAQTATDLGLVSHLVDVSNVNSTIDEIAQIGKPANKYLGIPNNSDSKVAKFASAFYSDENIETILAGNCPAGFDSEDRNVSKQLRSISRTAPIALKVAADLIDKSSSTNLSEGLECELKSLEHIFSTADALEGLSALIEGRKPAYQNK
ncbi:MAG: 3-hydroxyacyl-CoA dehydrogenase NAD-binding domain-containing protein [Candidatus Poseidoniaceae archaeon]|nr:3-hydroxyacyl-CoA dehydrogenase NAD-binding domain-containing protein [Candidatus Poseidoniaceae archaeon]